MVVHIYVAGMAALILLERRFGLQDEDPVESLAIFARFGMFVVALLVAKRPAKSIGWILSAASRSRPTKR